MKFWALTIAAYALAHALTWALRRALFGKAKQMSEKDIALGSIGKLALSFSGGKAIVSAQAAVDGGVLTVEASVTGDAGALIDQLEALVAKAIPATAALDPAIFGVIKQAVL